MKDVEGRWCISSVGTVRIYICRQLSSRNLQTTVVSRAYRDTRQRLLWRWLFIYLASMGQTTGYLYYCSALKKMKPSLACVDCDFQKTPFVV